jgi:hypothetical protein
VRLPRRGRRGHGSPARPGGDALDGGDHGFRRADEAADELVEVRGEPAEPGFVRAVTGEVRAVCAGVEDGSVPRDGETPDVVDEDVAGVDEFRGHAFVQRVVRPGRSKASLATEPVCVTVMLS